MPPSNLYEEIKALDGIVLEATYTSDQQHYDNRMRWTGKGDEYEVIETGLTYPDGYSQPVSMKAVRTNVSDYLHNSLVAHCELLTEQIRLLPSDIASDRRLYIAVLDSITQLYNEAFSEEEVVF